MCLQQYFLESLANSCLGTADANYEIGNTGQFPGRPSFAAVGSVAVGMSKIASLGITFVPGSKDIAPSLHGLRTSQERIVSAKDWTVLFHDVLTRQAWLLDGPSALLHICRAWLSSESARLLCMTTPTDPISVFQHAQSEGGIEGAIRLLLCSENRNIELYKTDGKPTIESSIERLTNQRKVEKKFAASWHTWGDVVDARVLALEFLHDHLIKRRSSRKADLRLPVHGQLLEGYDFREIMELRSQPQTWEKRMHSSFGGWLDVANSVNAVPIFGSGFGDLLRPTGTSNSGLQACGQKVSLPRGDDFLAVPLYVIHRICKGQLERRDIAAEPLNCLQVGTSTYWLDPETAFAPCACGKTACQISIARLANSAPAGARHMVSLRELFSRNPRGAVIFPCNSHRLRKRLKIDPTIDSGQPGFKTNISNGRSVQHSQRKVSNSDVGSTVVDSQSFNHEYAPIALPTYRCLEGGNRRAFDEFSDADMLLVPPALQDSFVNDHDASEAAVASSSVISQRRRSGELIAGEGVTNHIGGAGSSECIDLNHGIVVHSQRKPRPLRKMTASRTLRRRSRSSES